MDIASARFKLTILENVIFHYGPKLLYWLPLSNQVKNSNYVILIDLKEN